METIMNQNKIEELKAKVAAAVEANAARIKEEVEIAKLEAQLRLQSSEALLQTRVRQQAQAEETAKLQNLLDECSALVAGMPILNPKTRSNRVWSGGRKFAYGTQIDLIYQLVTGIQYSCAEHKAVLLEHTGLNTEVLEDVISAFGTPSYYSRNHHSIVEAKPYNVERVKGAVAVLQSQLGVVVDTSALNETQFKEEFAKGKTTAKAAFDQAVEALVEADFEM